MALITNSTLLAETRQRVAATSLDALSVADEAQAYPTVFRCPIYHLRLFGVVDLEI